MLSNGLGKASMVSMPTTSTSFSFWEDNSSTIILEWPG